MQNVRCVLWWGRTGYKPYLAGCARCIAALLGREVGSFPWGVNDFGLIFRIWRWSGAGLLLKIRTMMRCGLIINAMGLMFAGAAAAEAELDREACAYNGFPLYGDVQVVESFPDLKVQIVDSFPDLKVQAVESFPDDCGQWRFVESFPDLKIQYVESFPDLKIQMVESFPGLQ